MQAGDAVDVHAPADVLSDLVRQVVALEDEGAAHLMVVGWLEEALVEQDAVVNGEVLNVGGEALKWKTGWGRFSLGEAFGFSTGALVAVEAGVAAVAQAVGLSAEVGEVEGAPLDEHGPVPRGRGEAV